MSTVYNLAIEPATGGRFVGSYRTSQARDEQLAAYFKQELEELIKNPPQIHGPRDAAEQLLATATELLALARDLDVPNDANIATILRRWEEIDNVTQINCDDVVLDAPLTNV